MQDDHLLIRNYKNDDFEEISKLWESTGVGGIHRGDNQDVIDQTLKQGGKLIVLEDIEEKCIVGTSWLTNDGRRIYLHHFCIREDYRNMGLGDLLTLESINFAKKVGKQIKLEVHKDNDKAIKLYMKNGFNYLGDYLVYIVRDIN